jgi:acyl carrier protein
VDEIIARLQPIFRDVLDDENLVLTEKSSGKNVPGWDSLAHINLIAIIEKEFKIRFALGELAGLKNIGEMAALIEKKVTK